MPEFDASSDIANIWDAWKQITRFLESARIAFGREEVLWASLEVQEKDRLSLVSAKGPSTYSILLSDHLSTLRDDRVLLSLVVGASYGLLEAYGRLKVGVGDDDGLSGGIESWGKRLLETTGHEWGDVLDGLAGILEVSMVRNANAHGLRKVSQSMANRFASSGLPCPWSVGDDIQLTYESVDKYRARMKSLMRIASQRKRDISQKEAGPDRSAARFDSAN